MPRVLIVTKIFLVVALASGLRPDAVQAAPIAIPVVPFIAGSPVPLELKYELPAGLFLHPTQSLQLAFEFENLNAPVDFFLHFEVGGIVLPVDDLFQNVGGVFVPLQQLTDAAIGFIGSHGPANINNYRGFSLYLFFDAATTPNGSGSVSSVLLDGRYSDLSPFQTQLVPSDPPVTSTPEPGSMLLLATALAGLAVRRRQQRRM